MFKIFLFYIFFPFKKKKYLNTFFLKVSKMVYKTKVEIREIDKFYLVKSILTKKEQKNIKNYEVVTHLINFFLENYKKNQEVNKDERTNQSNQPTNSINTT